MCAVQLAGDWETSSVRLIRHGEVGAGTTFPPAITGLLQPDYTRVQVSNSGVMARGEGSVSRKGLQGGQEWRDNDLYHLRRLELEQVFCQISLDSYSWIIWEFKSVAVVLLLGQGNDLWGWKWREHGEVAMACLMWRDKLKNFYTIFTAVLQPHHCSSCGGGVWFPYIFGCWKIVRKSSCHRILSKSAKFE